MTTTDVIDLFAEEPKEIETEEIEEIEEGIGLNVRSNKRILGFCDQTIDYSMNIREHMLFEYVYTWIDLPSDKFTITDDEGNKYDSVEDFDAYIMEKFPGYLENGKCYSSVAFRGSNMGIQ